MLRHVAAWPGLLPLALLVFLAGTIVVLGRQVDKHEKRRIDEHTAAIVEQTALRLSNYAGVRLGSLELLRNSWREGEDRSFERFRRLALSQDQHIGGLVAINWIDPDGVIRWVVPDEGNSAARGRSVADSSAAGPILAEARRSGTVRATPPVDLFQGGRGVACYVPVAATGAAEGFINGVFRVEPLIAACLTEEVAASHAVSIRDGREVVLVTGAPVHDVAGLHAASRELEVGGRTWTLTMSPTPALVASLSTINDELLLGMALLLVLGIFGLQWWLIRSRRLLQEREARLQSIADHIPGVVYSYEYVPGRPRRLIHLGPGLDEIVGADAAAAVESNIDSLFDLVHADDRIPLNEGAARAVAHREIFDTELRLKDGDGGYRWVRSLCRPVPREGGCSLWHIVLIDVDEQKRAEASVAERAARERLLLMELDHRVRNNLSSLISLIELGGRRTDDPRAFADSLSGRVQSMAHVHGLLSQARWSPVTLRSLLLQVIPGDLHARLDVDGRAVEVAASRAGALGMILHELATNCVKHGALRSERGRIRISWTPAGDTRWHLRWCETGSPRHPGQPASGVGTSLIEGLVRSDLQGIATLRYTDDGVDHVFEIAVAESAAVDAPPPPAPADEPETVTA